MSALSLILAAAAATAPDPGCDDYGTLCLALAVFSEARGEPVEGQLAVAMVALNRVDRELWPDSICDVVEQHRAFDGLHRWAYPRDPLSIDAEAWSNSLDVAARAISGDLSGVPAECEGATHFYTGPTPSWAHRMEFRCTVGAHHFLREKRR